MKCLLFAALLVVTPFFATFGGAALAADVATEAGTVALLFEFRGLDNLALLDYMGGIGVRWYPADRWALRPGVGYAWDEAEWPAEDVNGTPYSGRKTSADAMQLSLVLERRFTESGPVSPYIGLGAGYQRRTSTSTFARPADVPDGTSLKQSQRVRGWSALLLGGVEFGLMDRLTVGAEYVLQYAREKHESEVYFQNAPSDMDNHQVRRVGISTTAIYVAIGL